MEKAKLTRSYELLVIGGSAGSLEVILNVLPNISESQSYSIIIVLHRKGSESLLAELLSVRTSWPVKEAEEKDVIIPGHIYVAPADYHLLVEKDHTLSLDYSEKLHYSRPGIDASFETAAEAYGEACACLLLSGANADGTQGMKRIKELGGLTLVQHPADASVSYMPQQAVDSMSADYILNTVDMAAVINQF